jgi:hypothetical protein
VRTSGAAAKGPRLDFRPAPGTRPPAPRQPQLLASRGDATIARVIAIMINQPVSYRPVETDGTARTASMLAKTAVTRGPRSFTFNEGDHESQSIISNRIGASSTAAALAASTRPRPPCRGPETRSRPPSTPSGARYLLRLQRPADGPPDAGGRPPVFRRVQLC